MTRLRSQTLDLIATTRINGHRLTRAQEHHLREEPDRIFRRSEGDSKSISTGEGTISCSVCAKTFSIQETRERAAGWAGSTCAEDAEQSKAKRVGPGSEHIPMSYGEEGRIG